MRTTQILTSFAAALLFAGLATRAFAAWARLRERRSAHLAIATGLFAMSQFISANSSAFYNSLGGHAAPRWIGVTSGIIGALAQYAFVLFLFDFVKAPAVARALVLLGTLEFILLTVIETASVKIVGQKFVFVSHPIEFRTYLYILVGWYLFLTGTMWLSFLLYGFRNKGLVRFRMFSISGGFFLIFMVIGAIPLVLLENATSFVQGFATVLGLFILLSAPLLFVGFTPPRWILARFPEASARSRLSRSAVA